MHNALAVFVSLIISISTSTALYLPQFRFYSSLSQPSKLGNVADKCTFILWHKQLCSSSTKTNYVQLNTIIDHPNDFVIDIAAYRPRAARNSYNKLSEKEVVAVEGLIDGKSLTIRGNDGSDEVTFEYDTLTGSSETGVVGGDAYCVAEKWDVDNWQCGTTSRERKIQCAFSCEKVDEEDMEGFEREAELR